jgi:hypothetical protein
MRRCGSLATSIASQLRGSTCSTSQITVASLTDAAACTCNAVIAEHAARVASSMHCSTSGNTHKAELWSLRVSSHQQQCPALQQHVGSQSGLVL